MLQANFPKKTNNCNHLSDRQTKIKEIYYFLQATLKFKCMYCDTDYFIY